MKLEKVKTTKARKFASYDIAATYAINATYDEVEEMQKTDLSDRIIEFASKELNINLNDGNNAVSFGNTIRNSFTVTFHIYHLVKKQNPEIINYNNYKISFGD